MSDIIAPNTRIATARRHVAAAARVRLVPTSGFTYAPRGRASIAPTFVARHAAGVTGISAAAALVGSSATAIALMLGLGR
ncbi:hypothetical protein GCM10025867_08910 [Frondihabitans sucicola]|uniref:Uncharacterized protein n=1 Tax=Frondihabitans sucicola TaxID=1268041 RepID=A0ABM8GJU7_9MICO|nr:hypothetical protein [Frondihabitans sucicola]BDZ48650.1 hypothetical protein GCM10025867_08910 [Frondihabitans sucicola]